jgi:hypothetical protein
MYPIRNTKPSGNTGSFINNPSLPSSSVGGDGINLKSELSPSHSELRSLANSAISSIGNSIKQGISSKVGSLFS